MCRPPPPSLRSRSTGSSCTTWPKYPTKFQSAVAVAVLRQLQKHLGTKWVLCWGQRGLECVRFPDENSHIFRVLTVPTVAQFSLSQSFLALFCSVVFSHIALVSTASLFPSTCELLGAQYIHNLPLLVCTLEACNLCNAAFAFFSSTPFYRLCAFVRFLSVQHCVITFRNLDSNASRDFFRDFNLLLSNLAWSHGSIKKESSILIKLVQLARLFSVSIVRLELLLNHRDLRVWAVRRSWRESREPLRHFSLHR